MYMHTYIYIYRERERMYIYIYIYISSYSRRKQCLAPLESEMDSLEQLLGSAREQEIARMYVYIYIYIYMYTHVLLIICICIYIYIYIYIERERGVYIYIYIYICYTYMCRPDLKIAVERFMTAVFNCPLRDAPLEVHRWNRNPPTRTPGI